MTIDNLVYGTEDKFSVVKKKKKKKLQTTKEKKRSLNPPKNPAMGFHSPALHITSISCRFQDLQQENQWNFTLCYG
jgi:hypothetical protein